jgi:hypothetical protein
VFDSVPLCFGRWFLERGIRHHCFPERRHLDPIYEPQFLGANTDYVLRGRIHTRHLQMGGQADRQQESQDNTKCTQQSCANF